MMRSFAAAAAALALAAAPTLAAAVPASGSAQINYKILPSVRAQVIPNYGAFTVSGGAGSGSTPAAGPAAVANGGTVDFGNVVVGFNYLYSYAAQVNVQSNDKAGFVVYAEGATDLNGSNPTPTPATSPILGTLYWLIHSSGNSAFSAATSFNKTTGTPIGVNGANGIDYSGQGGLPSAGSVVWTAPTSGSLSQGYDYQLRLPGSIPTSQFDVYIVYTVIGN